MAFNPATFPSMPIQVVACPLYVALWKVKGVEVGNGMRMDGTLSKDLSEIFR